MKLPIRPEEDLLYAETHGTHKVRTTPRDYDYRGDRNQDIHTGEHDNHSSVHEHINSVCWLRFV